MLLREFPKVIVVDWSCPDNSGVFALSEGARVICQPNEDYFSPSKARNLGAHHADTEWLCFVDADTLVGLGVGMNLEMIVRDEKPGMVLAARDSQGYDTPDLMGFLAVRKSDFDAVGGYDESFNGWGCEDIHLRMKLCLERGVADVARLGPDDLLAIAHTNRERQKHHNVGVLESGPANYARLDAYMVSKGLPTWANNPRFSHLAFRKRPYA